MTAVLRHPTVIAVVALIWGIWVVITLNAISDQISDQILEGRRRALVAMLEAEQMKGQINSLRQEVADIDAKLDTVESDVADILSLLERLR